MRVGQLLEANMARHGTRTPSAYIKSYCTSRGTSAERWRETVSDRGVDLAKFSKYLMLNVNDTLCVKLMEIC